MAVPQVTVTIRDSFPQVVRVMLDDLPVCDLTLELAEEEADDDKSPRGRPTDGEESESTKADRDSIPGY